MWFENEWDRAVEDVSAANGCGRDDAGKVALFARFLGGQEGGLKRRPFPRFEEWLRGRADCENGKGEGGGEDPSGGGR